MCRYDKLNIIAIKICIILQAMHASIYLFVDIDECSVGTDDCGQECVNTEGNYTCQCFPNYRLINATDCEGIIIMNIVI